MKSPELIRSLSADLKPVTPVRYGLKVWLTALGASVFSVLAGIAISGVRADLRAIAPTPAFISQSLVLLLLAVLSIASAMQMSIPGLKNRMAQKIAAGTLTFWALILLYLLANTNRPFAGWGFSCAREIALNSILPALAVFLIVRRAAVLNRSGTAWAVLTAGAACGALATFFCCNVSNPLHLLIWHALPVGVIGLMGYGCGKFIFKKL